MMSEPSNRGGLFVSLRRLLATVLEIAQVRLDLLATELELEKRRIFDGLLWAILALLIFGVGVVLLCGFIILLFSEGYRVAAVGVLSLLFLGAAALLVRQARHCLRSPKGMFDASLAELQQDRAGLQPSGPHESR